MTSEEITQALASIGQHHTRAQRELLQLTLRLQREGMQEKVEGARPAGNTLPEILQEDAVSAIAGASGQPEARPTPSKEQALATAKEVLKDQFINHNQAHLLHLVDTVEQSDLDAFNGTPVRPTPVMEPPAPVYGQANVEFFRDLFNAQTLAGGRGPIGEGMFGLKHYQQDVRLARQAHLKEWPSGFYTDHTTQATQFMLNRADLGWAILIEGMQRADIRVSTLDYNKEEFPRFTPMAATRLGDENRQLLAGCFRQAFRL